MSFEQERYRRWLKWAAEARLHALERLASGKLLMEQYHYTCGYIKCLDDSLEEDERITRELQGE